MKKYKSIFKESSLNSNFIKIINNLQNEVDISDEDSIFDFWKETISYDSGDDFQNNINVYINKDGSETMILDLLYQYEMDKDIDLNELLGVNWEKILNKYLKPTAKKFIKEYS